MSVNPMRAWPSEDADEADHAEVLPGGGRDADQDTGGFAVAVEDDGMPAAETLREALKAVLDPEIGVNIVDLGLVYGVTKDAGVVDVRMTLTSMGCPLTELLHQQCTMVMARMPGVETVNIDFTFDPPWSPEMLSEDARLEMRAMGFSI